MTLSEKCAWSSAKLVFAWRIRIMPLPVQETENRLPMAIDEEQTAQTNTRGENFGRTAC